LNELVTFTLSAFISGMLFIFGFILGAKQSKDVINKVGHNISEKILDALKLAERGELPYAKYNRVTGNFEIENPESTTASP